MGPEGAAKASTVVVTPAGPGEPPHISAPGLPAEQQAHGGGGVMEKVKNLAHALKEITPGTKVSTERSACKPARAASPTTQRLPFQLQEHHEEYGTDVALGGYRSQLGKR